MFLVTNKMMTLLKERFGEDFVFGIETSANQVGVYKGAENFINLYSNRVTKRDKLTIDGIKVIVEAKPKLNYELVKPYTLSLESIFLLSIHRDEFITGESWDTLTSIVEIWGKDKTQYVLSKLPPHLYDMNAQDLLEHFSSEGFGA